jgi:FkbM family methyltransferase
MIGSSTLPDGSHTLALIQEALAATEDMAGSWRINQLTVSSAEPLVRHFGKALRDIATVLNRLAAVAGIHVARMSSIEALRSALESFRYDWSSKWASVGMTRSALLNPRAFDSVYDSLEDDASKTLFDWFVHVRVAYAMIGEQALIVYPAPISCDDYDRLILSLGRGTTKGYHVGKWIIESDTDVIVDSMLQEQYSLHGVVEPQHGDVVLDIGAYKGETTLWFADKVGPEGLVLALEPGRQTCAVLRRNIDRNQLSTMAPIRVLPCAAGAHEGTARFIAAGGAAALGAEGETTVAITTVDALVAEQHLARVDFIKMDIEGGEVDALRGAEETLRRFAPRLAITVYHRPNDLPDVVAVVRQACPSYRLYLSHKSPRLGETVVFAGCP